MVLFATMKKLLLFLAGVRLFAPALQPRFRPPQSHPFRVPGRTVFVGDDEFVVRQLGPELGPPLLVIHGLGGTSTSEWYKVAPLLADRGHRVIMVDNRNHGLAPKNPERTTIEDLADDLVGVLDALGEGQVDVAGYSMGGAVAQAIAHRYRNRVRTLTLVASLDHHPALRRVLRDAWGIVLRAWERMTGVGTPEVRSGYLLAIGAVESEHGQWLWQEMHRRDADAGAQALWATVRFDGRGWLERDPPPTTVVVPRKDQIVPSAWQLGMAERIPGSDLVQLDGRHELLWTHPEEIASIIATRVSDH